MKYGSVCSGIEAATVAWSQLGWEAQFFSEIEEFPRCVLQHHYPNVPLHGDFTTIGANDYGSDLDVLIGGTPCQSFSVAGLRGGMDDERGNLALEFLRLAQRKKPRWIVWENVPGVLSSNGGRDFGAFLGGLGELGYGFSWSILDAQYAGLAQRRRRVFVVGCNLGWQPAAAVLFDETCLRWDSPPRRESRISVARESLPGPEIYECHGQDSRVKNVGDVCTTVTAKYGTGGGNVPIVVPDIAKTLSCPKGFRLDYETETFVPTIGFSSNMSEPDAMVECAPTLKLGGSSGANPPAIAVQNGNTGANGRNWSEEVSHTLDTANPPIVTFAENQRGELRESDVVTNLNTSGGKPGQGYPAIRDDLRVRRLTPVECERLQGFPDDYTNVPYKHYDRTPDTPRYKALGNSFAVPVVYGIGKRIQMVDTIMNEYVPF